MGLWVSSVDYIVLGYSLRRDNYRMKLLVQDTDDFSVEEYNLEHLIDIYKSGVVSFENFKMGSNEYTFYMTPFFAKDTVRIINDTVFYMRAGWVNSEINIYCGGMQYCLRCGKRLYMPEFRKDRVCFHGVSIVSYVTGREACNFTEKYDFSIPYDNAPSRVELIPTDSNLLPAYLLGKPSTKAAFLASQVLGV